MPPSTDDVVELHFRINVSGESVPCVLWTPAPGVDVRRLIAFGHGGSQHKMSPAVRNLARRYVTEFGWAGLAIDAPGHGARITPEAAATAAEATRARIRGEPGAPALCAKAKIAYLDALTAQAVPEWKAALDEVVTMALPNLASIGYWGISQGTSIGIPLLAVEPRIHCAVLGLTHLHPEHDALRNAARAIKVPIRFTFQWDDPIRHREFGVALFNAIGSLEKSMHVYPGGHQDTPESERACWAPFFLRFLA